MTLIPTRSTFRPGEPIAFERVGAVAAVALEVRHLGRVVATSGFAAGETTCTVPALPIGGYAARAGAERTAFDVLADPFDRPRYGFVVRMTGDVDRRAVAANFRRHHLNIAQFYDWAYRHSQLMPPTDEYLDPLGQPRTLQGVNALARAFADAGVVPLGYTAVYGVGADELERWSSSLLRRADGEPYRFGDDFLLIVDPAAPVWKAHYLAELEAMLAGTAFAGFHLDQYGWPKRARTSERPVDLADSFVELLEDIRARLPESRFIFNNVNDFPVEATAPAPQDATYIEVWPPHVGLGDLGALALKARALRPAHPPILSAYLSCFGDGDLPEAMAAARLTMATIFSHGATHLLLGEESNVLIHAYYPNNRAITAASNDVFARWYDFAVAFGDLLIGPDVQDVSEQFAGGVNDEFVLESDDGVVASTKPEPGTVWLRVARTARGFVVHLVNLVDQTETAWDALKTPPRRLEGLRLRAIPVRDGEPVPWIASPDDDGELTPLEALPADVVPDPFGATQQAVSYRLPSLETWSMIWFPLDEG